MPRKLLASLTGLLVLAITFGLWWSVIAHASPSAQVDQPPPLPTPARERQGDADAPNISFIDSPEPACLQADRLKDLCFIQWRYLYVTATSPAYMITMSVKIDDRLRAYYSGFFQTWMQVPAEMSMPGFAVNCGKPGAAGLPGLGRAHSFEIRARETGGLRAANYGSVVCPAGPHQVFIPHTRR